MKMKRRIFWTTYSATWTWTTVTLVATMTKAQVVGEWAVMETAEVGTQWAVEVEVVMETQVEMVVEAEAEDLDLDLEERTATTKTDKTVQHRALLLQRGPLA